MSLIVALVCGPPESVGRRGGWCVDRRRVVAGGAVGGGGGGAGFGVRVVGEQRWAGYWAS